MASWVTQIEIGRKLSRIACHTWPGVSARTYVLGRQLLGARQVCYRGHHVRDEYRERVEDEDEDEEADRQQERHRRIRQQRHLTRAR